MTEEKDWFVCLGWRCPLLMKQQVARLAKAAGVTSSVSICRIVTDRLIFRLDPRELIKLAGYFKHSSRSTSPHVVQLPWQHNTALLRWETILRSMNSIDGIAVS